MQPNAVDQCLILLVHSGPTRGKRRSLDLQQEGVCDGDKVTEMRYLTGSRSENRFASPFRLHAAKAEHGGWTFSKRVSERDKRARLASSFRLDDEVEEGGSTFSNGAQETLKRKDATPKR